MKYLKIKFLAIILFAINGLMAQQATTYYMRVQSDFVHITQRDRSNVLRVESNVSAIDQVLNRSNIKEFIHVFPDATDWTNEIYYVVAYNENLKEELNTEEFRRHIISVSKLCHPMLTSHIPNDPIYRERRQTDLDLINASAAWAIAKYFPRVNVAITDTYFDMTHEDLSMTLVGGNNTAPTDPNLFHHGTFVAGRVGAITNNGVGIASIGGYNTNLYVSTIWGSDMEVLRLARAGYRVINCSWFNRCSFSLEQEAFYDRIRNVYNTVVVFGAGNGSDHCNGGKVYPASYASNVSVTSVGHKHERGVFIDGETTNWKDVHKRYRHSDGSIITHQHNEAVDISAPGYAVYSTASANDYWPSNGTSFAAPQVAAVAAMILAINPNLTANEVVAILKNTADSTIYDIPENAPYRGLLGAGRLDAYAAVKAAAATIAPTISGSTFILPNTSQTYLASRWQTGFRWEVSSNLRINGAYTNRSVSVTTTTGSGEGWIRVMLGTAELARHNVRICTAATLNFTNQTVTTNRTVVGCNINVQNVTITNNARLELDAPGTIRIEPGFRVEPGATLRIK